MGAILEGKLPPKGSVLSPNKSLCDDCERKKDEKKAAPKKTAAKKKAAKKKTARKTARRKRFKVPGHEALVAIVKKAGAKGITSGDIVKQWKKQGRGSGVHVELGKLVKAKKLTRENLKGQRGSLYRAA